MILEENETNLLTYEFYLSKYEFIEFTARLVARVRHRAYAIKQSKRRFGFTTIFIFLLILLTSYAPYTVLLLFYSIFLLYLINIIDRKFFQAYALRKFLMSTYSRMHREQNKCIVVLSETELSQSISGKKVGFPWTFVDDIVATVHGIEIDAMGNGVFLPERIFVDKADMDKVETVIRARWKSALSAENDLRT